MIGYLGVDVGSISTKGVIIDQDWQIIASTYLRTQGQPIAAIKELLTVLYQQAGGSIKIVGAGTTGSARRLAGVMLQADIVKNEIIAHAVSASHFYPEVRTVIEIGGQDSKVILLRHGVVVDFAMNTVCAAGTGSFLDQQAGRLGISIEEFGFLALKSNHPVRIAGRCTVFGETDMIHKQQMGHPVEDIVAGLCESLVKNYLNNVCRGKEILSPIVFQGGVAANQGIQRAFEKELATSPIVPEYFDVMGAIGAAKLVKRAKPSQSRFKGFDLLKKTCLTHGFECNECDNQCEVVQLIIDGQVVACWGDLCERYRKSNNQTIR